MIREIVVLRGQQGVDEVRRDVGELDGAAAHFAELGDQLVVGAVDAQRDLHAHVAQGFHRRQAGAEVEKGATESQHCCADQGDTGPRQKLQQTHRDLACPGRGMG
ncbi:hypothetical protein D3C78_1268510 [compost metagenome]